jgi:hypothetical protein
VSELPSFRDLDCYLNGDYQPTLRCGLEECDEILMFCDAGASLNDMVDAAIKHEKEGCRGRGA